MICAQKSEKSNTDESIEIMVEPEQVMYGSRGGGHRGRFVKGNRSRGGNGRNTFGGNPSYENNGKQSNGNQWTQYLDTRKRLNLQLFSEQSEMCFLEQFVSETLNCAIVDSGCIYNVCGKNWLKCYMDKFPYDRVFEEKASTKSFKFGPCKVYTSRKQVNIPVILGGTKAHM